MQQQQLHPSIHPSIQVFKHTREIRGGISYILLLHLKREKENVFKKAQKIGRNEKKLNSFEFNPWRKLRKMHKSLSVMRLTTSEGERKWINLRWSNMCSRSKWNGCHSGHCSVSFSNLYSQKMNSFFSAVCREEEEEGNDKRMMEQQLQSGGAHLSSIVLIRILLLDLIKLITLVCSRKSFLDDG